ncbi:MAG: tRNA dihydrouridine synthase DusB [Candidatus Omnitrophota bacterium]
MKNNISDIFKIPDSRYPVMLSPMSGISTFPYRMLNRRFGCEFAFLEMIDARSLAYKNLKTFDLMKTGPGDRPIGVQLLGREAGFMEKAIERLNILGFDVLDFNAACPKKKVVNKGKGASLLKEPKELCKILKLLVKISRIPVTLKMRIGWSDRASSDDIALMVQDAGVKAVTVHGRTALDGYRGTVDYDAIREIKKALSIPVIASGDILSSILAKKMFDETGCDAIMVARGALGNPWIFPEIKEFLEKGIIIKRPSVDEVINIAKEHFKESCRFFGEEKAIRDFRKFFIWYTRGFNDARLLRIEAAKTKTSHRMLSLIEELRDCADEAIYR